MDRSVDKPARVATPITWLVVTTLLGLSLLGLSLLELSLAASPAASGPVATDDQPRIDESVPAPVVVETIEGPEVDRGELDRVLGEIDADRQARRTAFGGQPLAAASRDGLFVSYLTEPPADVQAVVEAAANDWAELVMIGNGAPVEIQIDWRILPANILGLAAPTSFERSPDLPRDALYPVALANSILGLDRQPDLPEISITLASGLYETADGWFVDPTAEAAVPPDKLDLYTIVLHEIGHGLGFTGSARNGELDPDSAVFDLLTIFEDQPVVGSGRESEALVSGELFIDIGDSRPAELFAPPRFINRVSFSHFDESPIASDPGALMTPAFASGERNRVIDAATLGVMTGLGWTVDAPVLAPRIRSVVAGDEQMTVEVSNLLDRTGLPPVRHRVDVRSADGTLLASEFVGWESDQITLSPLPNDVDLRLSVTPIGSAEVGTAGPWSVASQVVSDRPSTLSVSGNGLSRSLTWIAPGRPQSSSPVYLIERRRIGGSWTQIGSSASTFFIDNSLGEATPSSGVYQYRVSARFGGTLSRPAVSPIVGVSSDVARPMALDGQISRLYSAFLGRGPDESGLQFWMQQRATGTSLTAVAAAFAASDEFALLSGQPDDASFLDLVYRRVLGRAPDPAGLEYWLGRLAAGMSRGELVVRFSEAPEYVIVTGTEPPTVGPSGAIIRLYWAYLQRPTEAAGLAYWVDQVEQGRSLGAIAEIFSRSPEFEATYGSLTNHEFVDLVYDNVLGRTADDGAFNFWFDQLTTGTGRGQVMLAFANGPEFVLETGTIP